MNINNIIQEELSKVINESYTMDHDNFHFRQRLTNSRFFNYNTFSNDYDVDINESDIIINWHIQFELNQSGIENFIVTADSVEGIYKVGLLDKQSDEVVQMNDKNIAEFQWKFKIENANLLLRQTLYVENLVFDFKSKICIVTFFANES